MKDDYLRAYLSHVEYKDTPVDPNCGPWNGLLEFAVKENGSYAAAVPFEDLVVPFGGSVAPDILVYDGLGSYCGVGTQVTLDIRVNVSGMQVGSLLPVSGWRAGSLIHPGSNPISTNPPLHPQAVYSIVVPIKIQPPGRINAKLWFHFTVGTMC